jgi:aminoglycoside phosphotransferase (APT) family kinase protein
MLAKYIKEIETLIRDYYQVDNLLEIDTFKPTFSKFKNYNQHFFVVRTSNFNFFVKRYQIKQKERALNDILRSLEYQKKTDILIPQFFKNNEGEYCTYINNDYYVVMQYIEGDDLRKINETVNNDDIFLNLYLDTCLELKKVSRPHKFSFKSRIDDFDQNVENLIMRLKVTKSVSAKRNLEYVIFLKSEVDKYRDKVNQFNINGQLIHGDLIKQNVIKGKDGRYWIVDWEKSNYGSIEIDLMRTLLFTYFKPHPYKVNLKPNNFIDVFSKYSENIKSLINSNVINEITIIFYCYLITNINALTRFYVDKVKLQEQMLDEDINILKWYKKNMAEIQIGINQTIQI